MHVCCVFLNKVWV